MRKILMVIFLGLNACYSHAQKKPNILFIVIDDLRPELGCYGSDIAITPNLDALAGKGLLFNKAYCQQAICAPSRASVLTGFRPSTSGIFHNYIKIREKLPDVVTLPQYFKSNGYEAAYYGKIFHQGDLDDSLSWTITPPDANDGGRSGYALPENKQLAKDNMAKMFAKYGDQAKQGLASGPAYECADVPDNTYNDGYNTDLAIATLKGLAKNDEKPFFLALGFHKPHLPWVAPKKYWDLYDPSKIKLTDQPNPPIDGAAMGLHASFELRTRSDMPKDGPIDDTLALKLKHAYLACTSYVDAQLGRILEALNDAGVSDNTIIIVWSDHGWHLGEMGVWGKATNYEIATRIPFIISAPGMPKNVRGETTNAFVELVDMYPTLCDLAGIETPTNLDGYSFAPLLQNPKLKWKTAAFSQFPDPALREWGAYPLRPGMRETFFEPLIKKVEDRIIEQQQEKWDRDLFENRLMGYTMRTDRYRLVVWRDTDRPDEQPIFIELYDHKKDPKETINVAKKNPHTVSKLLVQFNKGWQGNLPKSAR